MTNFPATAQEAADIFADTVAALGLATRAEFVPWSRSRNFKEDAKPSDRSLNWKVTLTKDGRDVMTFGYSAGVGHCPSYKFNARWTLDYTALIEWETEHGYPATDKLGGRYPVRRPGSKRIEPKTLDVVSSLILDASAIDYPTFEEWAGDLGYDTDSRKGEAAYRACLETALKLRAVLGDDGLNRLRDAASDY